MANINLLPWREAQRAERNKTTVIICVVIWAIAAGIVFAGKSVMDARITYQNDRNRFIQNETKKLAKVIREIETLREKRDALLARMEVIQNLQQNRSQIVHVFDDLVSKLPNGVYFDRVSKNSQGFSINGKAQSNGRVSALMRSLDASDWFDGASLKVVDVVDEQGALVSKFDLTVKEERRAKSRIEDF